jgi:hypothetical protein
MRLELEDRLDKAMGNRHGHKQLRRAARARMANTGESYQQARSSLLAQRQPLPLARPETEASSIGADLMPIRYFGLPLAMATFQIAGKLAVLALSGPQGRGPFPLNPLLALGSTRAVH